VLLTLIKIIGSINIIHQVLQNLEQKNIVI